MEGTQHQYLWISSENLVHELSRDVTPSLPLM